MHTDSEGKANKVPKGRQCYQNREDTGASGLSEHVVE
jgi:hypothetical protein